MKIAIVETDSKGGLIHGLPRPSASLRSIRRCSRRPGPPYIHVTIPAFLEHFGFQTLRDLPDLDMLENAGTLNLVAEYRLAQMTSDLGYELRSKVGFQSLDSGFGAIA